MLASGANAEAAWTADGAEGGAVWVACGAGWLCSCCLTIRAAWWLAGRLGTGRMWVVVYEGVVNGQVVVGVVVVGKVVAVGIVVVGVVGVTIAVVVVTADVVVVRVVIGLTREGWRKDRMDDFKMIGLILVGSVDSTNCVLGSLVRLLSS